MMAYRYLKHDRKQGVVNVSSDQQQGGEQCLMVHVWYQGVMSRLSTSIMVIHVRYQGVMSTLSTSITVIHVRYQGVVIRASMYVILVHVRYQGVVSSVYICHSGT